MPCLHWLMKVHGNKRYFACRNIRSSSAMKNSTCCRSAGFFWRLVLETTGNPARKAGLELVVSASRVLVTGGITNLLIGTDALVPYIAQN